MKAHGRCNQTLVRGLLEHDDARGHRHTQPALSLEIVELELDVRLVQGDVRAALHVRGAPARVVDGHAVHGDVHGVDAEGAPWCELVCQTRDVHTFVVVEHGGLVVHDLHRDVRRLSLGEAHIDHVARLHEAPALVLGLRGCQMHFVRDDLHRPTRPGGGQAEVVAVHRSGAPIEPLIARVAHEAQPHVGLVVQIRHGAPQALDVVGRDDHAPVGELQRGNGAPRRLIDLRHHLGTRTRAHLRLLGQLLQRVVVPELHFHAAVEGPSLSGVIRGERSRGTAPVARDRRTRELERFLHGERHPTCPRLRERDQIAVNALVAFGQCRIVRVADELDHHARLVLQVVQCLADLPDEIR